MSFDFQKSIQFWNLAMAFDRIAFQVQSLASTIVSYWTRSSILCQTPVVPIIFQIPPNSSWCSNTKLTISTHEGESGKIILDYGRCEGGLPRFEISSLEGQDNSTQFTVIYSESFKGLENDEGDGPYFLFSNAMNTYRRETYNVETSKAPITVLGRHAQQSQRYQMIVLKTPNSCVTFSRIGFQPLSRNTPAPCSFKCSDESVNRIYQDGVRTVEMCTLDKGETIEAWDVTSVGTRVFGQHWAPIRQGTRWGDKIVKFDVLVEHMGASWGIHMVANGLIFCLDVKKKIVQVFEGLSHLNTVFPAIDRGTWSLGSNFAEDSWITVEAVAIGSSVSLQLNGETVGKIDGLDIRPLLGGSRNNTGSVAFGGPEGYKAVYRNLRITDEKGTLLYENNLLPANRDRTMADFAVGTNLQACTIDGAKRDRTTFAGDLYVMARATYYSTSRIDAILGSILQLTSHQTDEGYLGNLCPVQAPLHSPEDESPTYAFYSLSYALLLIPIIRDYWLHTGDEKLVRKLCDNLMRLLNFTQRFLDERGLIVAPPPLSMDWFPLGGPIFGASSKINIAYYEALRAMSEMSTFLSIPDIYAFQATNLQASILKHLWNKEGQIMKMSDISPPNGIAQDINAYAVTTDIIPTSKVITLNNLTTTTHPPFAFQNLPGWDHTKIISPYASGFALEAHFHTHDVTGALKLLKRVWGPMADTASKNYSGAHWEAISGDGKTPFGHDTSLAHGWATWPVFLLPMYTGGVRVLEPGWSRWEVRPVLAELESVEAWVETVRGTVGVVVTVDVEAGRGDMRIRVPTESRCEIWAPVGWKFEGNTKGLDEVGRVIVQGRDTEVTFKLCII